MPDEAERCWRQALTLDPKNVDTLLDLGRLALSRRRLDEAVELLERSHEISPDSLEPVYNLSRAYRLKGDIARAQRYEALAAKLRPSQPARGGMGEMPADSDVGKGMTTSTPRAGTMKFAPGRDSGRHDRLPSSGPHRRRKPAGGCSDRPPGAEPLGLAAAA